jgi:hypothetical protein
MVMKRKNTMVWTAGLAIFFVLFMFTLPVDAGMRTRGYLEEQRVYDLRGVITPDGNLRSDAGLLFMISPESPAGREVSERVGERVELSGYVEEVGPQRNRHVLVENWRSPRVGGAASAAPAVPDEPRVRGYVPEPTQLMGMEMRGMISQNSQLVTERGEVFHISPYTMAGQELMKREGQRVEVRVLSIQEVSPAQTPVVTVDDFRPMN